MLLNDGGWVCQSCGAPVDARTDQIQEVKVTLVGRSRSVRVLSIDGEEVHRCAAGVEPGDVDGR